MTLGEKIRTYRTRAGMTQEELAAKLFVTRAAVSKWETDKGYPGIDSLRLIAKQFSVTLDELVSEEDAAGERRLQEASAKKMYVLAVLCFAAAVLFAVSSLLAGQPLLLIGAGAGCLGYLVFAWFSRPRWRRCAGNIVYRLIVFAVMAAVIIAVTVAGVV